MSKEDRMFAADLVREIRDKIILREHYNIPCSHEVISNEEIKKIQANLEIIKSAADIVLICPLLKMEIAAEIFKGLVELFSC